MRWSVLLLPVLAASAFFACGGSEDKINEDEAEDIAEDALLRESDLPGNGWQETARDEFDDDDEDGGFPDTDACEALNDLISETDDEDDDDEFAKTNVTFSREARSQAEVPFEVEAEIIVHEGTSSGDDLAEQFEEILDGADFDDCMEEFIAQTAEDAGGTGQYRRREPSVDAPDGGAALAFGFVIEIQNVRVEAVGEMYFWNEKHVESQLFLFGPPALFNEDLVEDVLDAAVERVSESQE
jgi:hypothetical protein